MDGDADGSKQRRHARIPSAWACCRLEGLAAAREAAAMANSAPPSQDALKAGLLRYSEGVLANQDKVPQQAQVPGPDPRTRSQPAVERMRAGTLMAYWYGGIHEVHSQRCNGAFAVRFSPEVERFRTGLPW